MVIFGILPGTPGSPKDINKNKGSKQLPQKTSLNETSPQDKVTLSNSKFTSAEQSLGFATTSLELDKRINTCLEELKQPGKSELEKQNSALSNIKGLIEEINAMEPAQKAFVLKELRLDFYNSIDENNFVKAAFIGQLFFESAELEQLLLPNTPKEKGLFAKMTNEVMADQAKDFIARVIDSKEYRWRMDGVAYLDGRTPNKELSCIAFTFEFLRSVYGTGNIQKEGRANKINLAHMTAEDLFGKFPDIETAPPFDPQINHVDSKNETVQQRLFKKIIKDVETDGSAMYMCQVYDSEYTPKHAFILIAGKDAKGQVKALMLESTPAGGGKPRKYNLVKRLGEANWHTINMVNIRPQNTQSQLMILKGHSIFGTNKALKDMQDDTNVLTIQAGI